MLRTLLRSYSTSPNNTHSNLIMAFIKNFISKKHMIFGGQWDHSPGHSFEVGIGRHNSNPAIATSRYHLEIQGTQLVCYDKKREQGEAYRLITDPKVKDALFSSFAQSIREPGSIKLWNYEAPSPKTENIVENKKDDATLCGCRSKRVH
jgi:hypothetical protein